MFNTRDMWQGILTITNQRIAPPTCEDDMDFLNELNLFGRFEALNKPLLWKLFPTRMKRHIAEVRRSLRRVNSRKSSGPDNIPDWVRRECADQLACYLTEIFNTSLDQAKTPSCFNSYCGIFFYILSYINSMLSSWNKFCSMFTCCTLNVDKVCLSWRKLVTFFLGRGSTAVLTCFCSSCL